jgi:hypothetical protein
MVPVWTQHGSKKRLPSRRAVGLFVLALLFFSGPVHILHHHAQPAAGGSDSSHQCLPCTAFLHAVFLEESGIDCDRTAILVADVVAPAQVAPAPAALIVGSPRAPPAPSV